MAIKFENIKAGMKLYDRHRVKMGNTTMSELGEWSVHIVKLEERGARVRWNGNPETFWGRRALEKLYTWSMYDKTEAVIENGKVRRIPKKERERLKAERDARIAEGKAARA